MQYDKNKIFSDLYNKLDSSISENNLRWERVVRLIITLSSSFLLGTAAFVNIIFDSKLLSQPKIVLLFLSLAWISSFLSIIFGVVTELNEVAFHKNLINKISKTILMVAKDDMQEAFPEDIIYDNSIWFGVITFNLFIASVLLYCLSLLYSFVLGYSWVILGICVALLILVNFFLIKKSRGHK
jgi:hypothetical protein